MSRAVARAVSRAVSRAVARALRNFRKYSALFSISFREQMTSPADIVARALFFAIIILVFSRLWGAVAATGSIGPVSSPRDLVWYLFITDAIVLSLPPLPEQVDHDLQTGNIAYLLVRPLDYVASRAMSYLGDVCARFAVNAGIGAVAAVALVGLPSHPAGFALLGPLLIGAFLIHLSISLSIAMLGFWVEDTLPFFWIYSKAAFILGGLFMPIDFYPPWIRRLCEWLPLRDGVYSVAQAVLGASFTAGGFLLLVGRQLLWAAAGITVAAFTYRAGVRRLEARGG